MAHLRLYRDNIRIMEKKMETTIIFPHMDGCVGDGKAQTGQRWQTLRSVRY